MKCLTSGAISCDSTSLAFRTATPINLSRPVEYRINQGWVPIERLCNFDRDTSIDAAEIAYVFGTFVWPFPWEEVDRKLSDTITSYWVNFAATGNPNGGGLTKWPAYSAKDDQALELGDQIAVRTEINKAGLDFFDGYYQSLAEKKGGTPAATK